PGRPPKRWSIRAHGRAPRRQRRRPMQTWRQSVWFSWHLFLFSSHEIRSATFSRSQCRGDVPLLPPMGGKITNVCNIPVLTSPECVAGRGLTPACNCPVHVLTGGETNVTARPI